MSADDLLRGLSIGSTLGQAGHSLYRQLGTETKMISSLLTTVLLVYLNNIQLDLGDDPKSGHGIGLTRDEGKFSGDCARVWRQLKRVVEDTQSNEFLFCPANSFNDVCGSLDWLLDKAKIDSPNGIAIVCLQWAKTPLHSAQAPACNEAQTLDAHVIPARTRGWLACSSVSCQL